MPIFPLFHTGERRILGLPKDLTAIKLNIPIKTATNRGDMAPKLVLGPINDLISNPFGIPISGSPEMKTGFIRRTEPTPRTSINMPARNMG